MSTTKIRVGLIGANVNYGFGTRAHIPALQALPEFELRAVCTAHRETAEQSARAYNVPLAFHDVQEMVRHPEIDLVVVAVRVPLHRQMVLAALDARKHVYCEWPLGANLREAEEIRDRAQAARVMHMVGLQGRGSPAWNQVKALIESGYIGKPVSATLISHNPTGGTRPAYFAWSVDAAKGANTLTIAFGHAVDALCYVLGEFITVAGAVATQITTATVAETGEQLAVTAPDNITVAGQMASGALASVHVSHVPAHGSIFRFEAHGTEGTIIGMSDVRAQHAGLTLHGARKDGKSLEPLPIGDTYRWVPQDMLPGEPYNVGQMLRNAARAIRAGSPAAPDFALAVTRHRLLDAIQRASDTGVRQRL